MVRKNTHNVEAEKEQARKMSTVFQNALNAAMWRRDPAYSGRRVSRTRTKDVKTAEIKIFAQKGRGRGI